MSSFSRQHKSAAPERSSTDTTTLAPQENNKPQQQGFMGWMQGAGDWVASKYDNITSGVGQWLEDVGQTSKDLSEAIAQTSISRSDGKWEVETDLDEVMDLLPMNSLQLDREASDNKVRIELDRQAGTIHIHTASLALSSVNMNGLSLANVRLENVEAILTNTAGNVPILGQFLLSEQGEKSSAEVHVGKAVGYNAVYEEGDSPVKAAEVHLEGLMIKSETGNEGFLSSSTQAQFRVSSAKIHGLESAYASGDISATQARGAFDSAEDSANFSAFAVTGQNLRQGDTAIDNASLGNVQGNITKGESGHIANVSAQSAIVDNLSSNQGEISQVAAQQMQLGYHENQQSIQASVGHLQTSGVDSTDVDVATANASNVDLMLDIDDKQVAVAADSVHAQGLDTSWVDASSIELGHASGHVDQLSNSTNASIATLQGSNLSSQHGSVATVSAQGIQANQSGQTVGASVDGAQLSTLSAHGHGQAEHLSVSGVNVGSDGHTHEASVSNLQAKGIQEQHFGGQVGSASVQNGVVVVNDQNLSASVNAATIQDASGFGAHTDSATVNQAYVSLDHTGQNRQATIGSIEGSNLSSQHGSVATVSAQGIQANQSGQTVGASVDGAQLSTLSAHGHGQAEHLSVSGVNVGSDGHTHEASVSNLQAKGIQEQHFGGQVGTANVQEIQVAGNSISNLQASMKDASLTDIQVADAQVGAASIHDGMATVHGDRVHASLASASFQDASVGQIVSASEGTASNLFAHGNLDEQKVGFGNANLHGVQIDGPQLRADVGTTSVNNALVHHTGGGAGSATADSAKVSDISFTAQNQDKSGQSLRPDVSPAIVDIDKKRLSSSVMERIETADIRANADLRPGTYGSGMAAATVKDDTTLGVNLQVRDNQIQDGSQIATSRSVGTALWTSTDGLYVKDNQMMADVNGWFDINASDKTNQGLGMSGKELHSLGEYGNAYANMPDKQRQQNDKSMPNPVDLSTLQASGQVGLGNGVIDAGGASVELAGNGSQNQLGIAADSNGIALAFASLLASSLRLSTNRGSVETGQAQVGGGIVEVIPKESTATGSIDVISVNDIAAQRHN